MNGSNPSIQGPYVVAAASLAVTVAAMVLLLVWDDAPLPMMLVTAVGPPVTALLLGRAAIGPGANTKRLPIAVLLGGSLIPVLVTLLYLSLFAVLIAFVEPLAVAFENLWDRLELEPRVVEVLGSPWAIVLMVHLALVAPIGEESLKPLAALVLSPESRRHAFLLGAGAGAGFAAIENIAYATGWFWSAEWWLPVTVLRSASAGLHVLGAAMLSVVLYERRRRLESPTSVALVWVFAVMIHALWNGSIAVSLVLFEGRSRLGASLGSALDWGIALYVFLAVLGVAILGGIVIAGRWARSDAPTPIGALFDVRQPSTVAAWAGLSVLLLIPATIMILVFPSFLAL